VGALDTDTTANGVVPRRLPAWTRPQITDLHFALVVTLPAGVRLELTSDTPELELDVLVTRLVVNGQPAKPAVFDLVIDGDLAASVATTEGTREPA